ncbi:response regulator [Loktanella sp. F6476L]|uniref:response regulator n=1 Tax=Loktanella sp. F6476L TaxID=2926405 RepID=UPI001FF2974D|nr:response regulator [Loktanella sp. F6476L]MCK0121805.1 response regulator [Loktanella sp. F6476L]
MPKKFRLNLRATILGSMCLVGVASGLIFAKVWVPRLNALSVAALSREVDRQLDVIADSLKPFILNNQFAAIHETLNALLNNNENWIDITLHESDGRQIFPIEVTSAPESDQFWSSSKAIMLQDKEIGELHLTVDFSSDLGILTTEVRNIGLIGLTLFLFTMLTIWMLIESLVIRRLKILADASRELSDGNYAAVLPPEGKDEVGALTSDFRKMRENIHANEIELKRAMQKAQDATVAKSQFLATMSHEIRTPLNGVIPVVELLSATDLDENQKRLTDTIEISGSALKSIIDDILDFSRLDAGRMSLRSEPYVLTDLIENVCDILGPSTLKRNISIQSYIDPALNGKLLGDGERLRQVILNLAGNASKFTEVGGIGITAEQLIRADGTEQLHVEITDSGIGISAEDLVNIFDRFTQVETGATKKFGGSGLGLSISHMLIDQMGGEIGVNSQVGVGSTFWFTIPIVHVSDVDEVRPIKTLAPKSIALIDAGANSTEGELIGRTLSEFGHDLCTFSSVQEMHAQCSLEARKLNHIVLNTPVGGHDVLALWMDELAKGPFAAIEKIVLSAQSDQDKSAAKSVEHNKWLIKPIHSYDLLDCFETHHKKPDQCQRTKQMQSPDNTSDHRQLHILIADDNTINQEVAAAILKTFGHQCVVANNGQEAVDKVMQDQFDLVLMDIQMPTMDGLEATSLIRASVEKPDEINIVGLSASATEDDAQQCYDAGMDSFISKPLTRAKIKTLVDSIP